MEQKKRIVYVINPRSGLGEKQRIEQEIKELTNHDRLNTEIVYTRHRGHAHQIATENRDKAFAVVAVGGDGTVNEVGTALIGSQTALGIIPSGSGNGLARALDIPLRSSLAIEVIGAAQTRKIDVVRFGDYVSLNVAGIGFDAYISHKFLKKRRRGPMQYVNLVAREFPSYVPQKYTLDIDGHSFGRTAFLISFANSSQWGNNVHIAPGALVDDGLLDVCIISEFPNSAIPALVVSLLNQSIDKNKYDEIIRARSIELGNDAPLLAHVDGEPVTLAPHARITTEPLALSVIVPSEEFLTRHRYTPSLMVDMMQQSFPQLYDFSERVQQFQQQQQQRTQLPSWSEIPKPPTISEFIDNPRIVIDKFNELQEITKKKNKTPQKK